MTSHALRRALRHRRARPARADRPRQQHDGAADAGHPSGRTGSGARGNQVAVLDATTGGSARPPASTRTGSDCSTPKRPSASSFPSPAAPASRATGRTTTPSGPTSQGWYWTGDLAYRDDAGFFYFAGRDHDWGPGRRREFHISAHGAGPAAASRRGPRGGATRYPTPWWAIRSWPHPAAPPRRGRASTGELATPRDEVGRPRFGAEMTPPASCR